MSPLAIVFSADMFEGRNGSAVCQLEQLFQNRATRPIRMWLQIVEMEGLELEAPPGFEPGWRFCRQGWQPLSCCLDLLSGRP